MKCTTFAEHTTRYSFAFQLYCTDRKHWVWLLCTELFCIIMYCTLLALHWTVLFYTVLYYTGKLHCICLHTFTNRLNCISHSIYCTDATKSFALHCTPLHAFPLCGHELYLLQPAELFCTVLYFTLAGCMALWVSLQNNGFKVAELCSNWKDSSFNVPIFSIYHAS